MASTSLDLSQIRTDALSSGATFRTLIGLGSSAILNAGSANGVATLDALGKLTAAQIPDISLISYLGSVASQAAMLALTGQQGDWCVRSDLSTTWVITGSDPTLLANWTQLSYPSVPVQSVFGRTGNIVGVSTDYSSVGITNTAIGASNPSTGAFTTLSATGLVSATSDVQHRLGQSVVWGDGDWGARWKWSGGGNGVGMAVGSFLPAVSSAMSLGEWNYTGWTYLYLATGANGANNGAILRSDAANTLALRNSTNQQRFNLYGTYSDASNYRRLYLDSTTAGAFMIGVEGAGTGASGNTLTIANTPAFSKGLTVNGSSGDWNCYIAPTLWAGANTGPSGAYLCNWTVSYGRTSGGIASIDSDLGLQVKNFARTADAPVTASALSLTDTWNSNVSVTGASGTGTTATLTFSAMTTAFPVGSTIVVSSVNPSGYNGTFTVTASTTTSVSYANTTTGAYVSGGNIKQLFTALKVNVTDTSSDTNSLLMDLQVGGGSKFKVDKAGTGTFSNGLVVTGSTGWSPLITAVGNNSVNFGTTVGIKTSNSPPVWCYLSGYNGGGFSIGPGTTSFGIRANWTQFTACANGEFVWTNGNFGAEQAWIPIDLRIARDAAGILAQRDGTNTQTFRLYRTADGSPGSNYERLALSSTTYSSAVYNTILCESGGTGAANINLVLSPKGTGAILAQVPDGTATGGNARGTYAVDLQLRRDSNTSVASGTYAVILGGSNNSTTGSWSGALCGKDNLSSGLVSIVCGGEQNTSGASYAGIVTGSSNAVYSSYTFIGGGFGNYIAGPGSGLTSDYGAILGGRQNRVYAQYGVVIGGYQGLADRLGQVVVGGGPFAALGDAQDSKFVLRIKTTSATPSTLLLCDGTTRLTIPSGKVFAFVAKISGIKSDGSAVAFYTRKGCIKNVGGATSLIGAIETIGTDVEDNTATDVAITADDTNDALQINVTGITGETWRWVAVVEGVEIGYGT